MKLGNRVVFGIFKSRSAVEKALHLCRDAGFRLSDISVLMPEGTLSVDFAHIKHSKAPEGATTGGAAGLVLGGTLGWLAGAGILAIAGLAPLVAAGPIIAAFAGAGMLGTIGSLTGGLIGLGIPEYEAKRFEGRVKDGGILFSVHADDADWVTKAEKILALTGAEDIATGSEVASDPRNPNKASQNALLAAFPI